MSARGFKAVYMTGVIAGAALGCYLVSLRVASERAQLDGVESQIAMTQRDIRLLQTEIGTRGRLAQLERWNANFIQLSAPKADQLVDNGFHLATLMKPQDKPATEAPVIYASAPAPAPAGPVVSNDGDDGAPATTVAPAPAPGRPDQMMHVAGYSKPSPQVAGKPISKPVAKFAAKPVTLALASPTHATNKGKAAAADPLAPLPKSKPVAKAAAPRKSKDSGNP
ncbi:hypothetical protein ABDK56_05425 [Sphingomonas sp. ASV193]|uniref:hypothetical protein n=1 Tax=Sphingomonas sp. ASV193 TaxID=3144405 RepID=UPI0032E8DC5B